MSSFLLRVPGRNSSGVNSIEYSEETSSGTYSVALLVETEALCGRRVIRTLKASSSELRAAGVWDADKLS